MEKLVYRHTYSDECTYSCDVFVTFEYSSKEDFILNLLEKWEQIKDMEYPTLVLWDFYLQEYEINRLEYNVLTLEEWFNENKQEYGK